MALFGVLLGPGSRWASDYSVEDASKLSCRKRVKMQLPILTDLLAWKEFEGKGSPAAPSAGSAWSRRASGRHRRGAQTTSARSRPRSAKSLRISGLEVTAAEPESSFKVASKSPVVVHRIRLAFPRPVNIWQIGRARALEDAIHKQLLEHPTE